MEMKKTKSLLFIAVIAIAALLASCASSRTQADRVPYKIADRYFFRNDATIPADPRITTRQQFDSLFGAAAVMGKNGQPTEIDFSRQFVIAVVKPQTNVDTALEPIALKTNGSVMTLDYKTVTGEKMSYSIQPCMLLVVDRRYDVGRVELNGL